jgi:hypothetical protein
LLVYLFNRGRLPGGVWFEVIDLSPQLPSLVLPLAFPVTIASHQDTTTINSSSTGGPSSSTMNRPSAPRPIRPTPGGGSGVGMLYTKSSPNSSPSTSPRSSSPVASSPPLSPDPLPELPSASSSPNNNIINGGGGGGMSVNSSNGASSTSISSMSASLFADQLGALRDEAKLMNTTSGPTATSTKLTNRTSRGPTYLYLQVNTLLCITPFSCVRSSVVIFVVMLV